MTNILTNPILYNTINFCHNTTIIHHTTRPILTLSLSIRVWMAPQYFLISTSFIYTKNLRSLKFQFLSHNYFLNFYLLIRHQYHLQVFFSSILYRAPATVKTNSAVDVISGIFHKFPKFWCFSLQACYSLKLNSITELLLVQKFKPSLKSLVKPRSDERRNGFKLFKTKTK